MNTKLLFWLYVNCRLSYEDEISGESELSIPELKSYAKDLKINWNDKYLWKTDEWLKDNIK